MANQQQREELHKTIWNIADGLRGAVGGWEFKAYVLGTLFYRFISENLTAYINKLQHDAGIEDFLRGRQVLELGRLAVYAVFLVAFGCGHTVDGLADNVEQASVDVLSNRHRDGAAKRQHFHSALQAVGAVHCNGSHRVLSDILLALKYYRRAIGTFHAQCIVNVWKFYIVIECHINNRTNNLRYSTFKIRFHICL